LWHHARQATEVEEKDGGVRRRSGIAGAEGREMTREKREG
jgi:hypothetical protein